MDHRIIRALDAIHEENPALAYVLTEILMQTKRAPLPRLHLGGLAQGSIPVYIIVAGLALLNFKLPEIVEALPLLKLLAGIP